MNGAITAIIVACGLASYSACHYSDDLKERQEVFARARSYADNTGKPLLVIGNPRSPFNPFFNHPCGDITIDINPLVLKDCSSSYVADIRDIPFSDGYFGACYCSHVLEHLPTIEDAEKAILEMNRVADRIFVVVPKKTSLVAWLIADHHLWVTPVEEGYLIEQR